jgi:hypothetical protein
MLVVLSVLSVVSTIGVTAFASITTSYRETDRRMALNDVAQRIFDSLERDCAEVTPSALCGVPVRCVRAMEETKRYGRVPLENDRLVLPISTYNPVTGRIERTTVMYAIDRQRVPQLVRTMQGGYITGDPAGAREILADDALSVRFECFDGKEWKSGWEAATNPIAIRCSVTVANPDWPDEQIARVATFPIRVR